MMIRYHPLILIHFCFNYLNQFFIFLNPIIQIAIKILLLLLVNIDILYFFFFLLSNVCMKFKTSKNVFKNLNSELYVFFLFLKKRHSILSCDLECLFPLFNPADVYFCFFFLNSRLFIVQFLFFLNIPFGLSGNSKMMNVVFV